MSPPAHTMVFFKEMPHQSHLEQRSWATTGSRACCSLSGSGPPAVGVESAEWGVVGCRTWAGAWGSGLGAPLWGGGFEAGSSSDGEGGDSLPTSVYGPVRLIYLHPQHLALTKNPRLNIFMFGGSGEKPAAGGGMGKKCKHQSWCCPRPRLPGPVFAHCPRGRPSVSTYSGAGPSR